MNFKKNESETKLRGGYYTPIEIASFLTKWVLKNKPTKILEPSCGDGIFIEALSMNSSSVFFTGIEINIPEAKKATKRLKGANVKGNILNTDFLSWSLNEVQTKERYDAILGNPPYIRYQYLEKKDQEYSEKIFKLFNLPFTKHTNAWVPFIIASISLLRAGGRLGMVIPAEILHVLHADSLRKFLLQECEHILLIDPLELLFEEALQGTVLLMVEKKTTPTSKSKGVAIVSVPDNSFLKRDPEKIFREAIYISGDILNGKWMKLLLEPEELSAFEKAKKNPNITTFKKLASVDVGIVTGANKFFLVDANTVQKFALKKYSHPMFGRSDHCRGVIYNNETHEENSKNGLPTCFINFGKTPLIKLPKKAQAYIKSGEKEGLHLRYKCRIRTPWYSVPSVHSTKIGMLKRSHNFPRLILNELEAYTTDTAYRISLKDKKIKIESFIFSFVNSLTALSAELEGRHYGGGVLELVPSEIEKLLIPNANIKSFSLRKLDTIIQEKGDAQSILKEQDEKILSTLNFSKEDIALIQRAWKRIRIRRQRLVFDDIT